MVFLYFPSQIKCYRVGLDAPLNDEVSCMLQCFSKNEKRLRFWCLFAQQRYSEPLKMKLPEGAWCRQSAVMLRLVPNYKHLTLNVGREFVIS